MTGIDPTIPLHDTGPGGLAPLPSCSFCQPRPAIMSGGGNFVTNLLNNAQDA